jgi:hypothetical protein
MRKLSEKQNEIFTKEFNSFISILCGSMIDDKKAIKENFKFCEKIGDVLEGQNMRLCLIGLTFNLLMILEDDEVGFVFDRVKDRVVKKQNFVKDDIAFR